MSNLLDKSGFNKQASTLLIKNNLHGSSVHCSYYSVVQYMLHIVLVKGVRKENYLNDVNVYRKSTHKSVITTIKDDLQINRNSYKDGENNFKKFQSSIADLKKLRETSDYKNEVCSSLQSDDALKRMENILNVLKQVYS